MVLSYIFVIIQQHNHTFCGKNQCCCCCISPTNSVLRYRLMSLISSGSFICEMLCTRKHPGKPTGGVGAGLEHGLALDGQRVTGGDRQVGALREFKRPRAGPRGDHHDGGRVRERPLGGGPRHWCATWGTCAISQISRFRENAATSAPKSVGGWAESRALSLLRMIVCFVEKNCTRLVNCGRQDGTLPNIETQPPPEVPIYSRNSPLKMGAV